MSVKVVLKCDPDIYEAYESWHVIKGNYIKPFIKKDDLKVLTNKKDKRLKYFFNNFFLVNHVLTTPKTTNFSLKTIKSISTEDKLLYAWSEVFDLINYAIPYHLFLEQINLKMPEEIKAHFFSGSKLTIDQLTSLTKIDKVKYVNSTTYINKKKSPMTFERLIEKTLKELEDEHN